MLEMFAGLLVRGSSRLINYNMWGHFETWFYFTANIKNGNLKLNQFFYFLFLVEHDDAPTVSAGSRKTFWSLEAGWRTKLRQEVRRTLSGRGRQSELFMEC